MSSNRVIRAGILVGVFGLAYNKRLLECCRPYAIQRRLECYDRDEQWTVCRASYRSGVQIANGAVISGGGLVDLQGQVTPKGAVRVTVQSGSQWAKGYGHLTKTRGGGQWRGQGTSGSCSGTWIAERR